MRYALDILAILTVVPKVQLALAETVDVFDEGGSTFCTVGESLALTAPPRPDSPPSQVPKTQRGALWSVVMVSVWLL